MLDPEAAIARTVVFRHAVIDVEEQSVGPLPDRMHHHLKPGGVRSPYPGPQ